MALHGVRDERVDVVLQLGQHGRVQIEHVPDRVVVLVDVAVQILRQTHVREGEIGREERRRHVEPSVVEHQLHARIVAHGPRQRRRDVAHPRQTDAAADALVESTERRLVMAPVPGAERAGAALHVQAVAAVIQSLAQIRIEALGERAPDRGGSRARGGIALLRIEPLEFRGAEARIEASRARAGAEQAALEDRQRDAQIGPLPQFGRQSGVAGELRGDLRLVRHTQRRALKQRMGVGAPGESLDLVDERRKIRRPRRDAVVVPGHCRIGRQVQLVGQIVARGVVQGRKVEHRRTQDHAIEVDPLTDEVLGEDRRARGAVALAQQEFRGFEPIVALHVALDELRERARIAIDPIEHLRLADADDAAVAGAHGIDEHQVGRTQNAVGVRHQPVRRLFTPDLAGCGPLDPSRTEAADVDQRGGEPRSAVVREGHRTLARIAHAVLRIGDVEHAGGGLALRVLQQDRTGGRRVADALTADHHAAVGNRGSRLGHGGGVRSLGRGLRCGPNRRREREGEAGQRQDEGAVHADGSSRVCRGRAGPRRAATARAGPDGPRARRMLARGAAQIERPRLSAGPRCGTCGGSRRDRLPARDT